MAKVYILPSNPAVSHITMGRDASSLKNHIADLECSMSAGAWHSPVFKSKVGHKMPEKGEMLYSSIQSEPGLIQRQVVKHFQTCHHAYHTLNVIIPPSKRKIH